MGNKVRVLLEAFIIDRVTQSPCFPSGTQDSAVPMSPRPGRVSLVQTIASRRLPGCGPERGAGEAVQELQRVLSACHSLGLF